MNNPYNVTKRILDLFFVLLFIFPSIILLILFSIVLFFQFRSNPFFVQERGLTLTKFRFKIFKLRTIKEDSTKVTSENEIFFKPNLKNQITPFAAWLRKTGLDELPQIFNVLSGKMSFIGPRPLMYQDLEIIKNENPIIYYKRESIESKPGISGLWQIFGTRSDGLLNLLTLDLIYDTYKTINIDLQLMLKTAFFILSGKNSDAIFNINKRNKKFVDITLSEGIELQMDSDLIKLFALPLLKSNKNFTYSLNLPQDFWTTTYTVSDGTTNASETGDRLSA